MDVKNLIKELNFKAIRSGGSGGQHVNKVSSKVELTFAIESSNELSEEEKLLLIKNLSPRLTKDKVLILFCDENRSQHKNKEIVTERFLKIIKKDWQFPKNVNLQKLVNRQFEKGWKRRKDMPIKRRLESSLI